MTQEKLLSVSDIARELDTGRTTIKFLLKRFKRWIPSELIDGQPFYSPKTIKTVLMIQEKIETGILPSDIEKKLAGIKNSTRDNFLDALKNPSQNNDIRLSSDGLTLLDSLFKDIGEQQRRIAAAHEKRAQVEEIKAIAIEKRAEAEEKKAEAMNNIANALQEMNKLRTADPAGHQIAYQAAAIIADDELDIGELDKNELNIEKIDIDSSGIQDAPVKTDSHADADPDTDNPGESEDDLSFLLDEVSMLEEFDNLDDLSGEFDSEIDDTLNDFSNGPAGDVDADLQMDDLSLLIDEDKSLDVPEVVSDELDDLSLLLDETEDSDGKPDHKIETAMDDLFKLIDAPTDLTDSIGGISGAQPGTPALVSAESAPLDDLSALIDKGFSQPALGTDDLPKTEKTADLDDLSKLIDTSEGPDPAAGDLDDLSLLIGQKESPGIKIDVSPEEDLKKYKAAIMKIIIELKTDGLSVEEATSRMNENEIKTLSGKPAWTQKAISQIYTFIDSAK